MHLKSTDHRPERAIAPAQMFTTPPFFPGRAGAAAMTRGIRPVRLPRVSALVAVARVVAAAVLFVLSVALPATAQTVDRRQPEMEFDLHSAQADGGGGIWSNGTTMWVLDSRDTYVYAYALDGGVRQTNREFDLHSDNDGCYDIWSDGTTMWVQDYFDEKVYAYALDGGARQTNREFGFHSSNNNPYGIWSDGTTMWVLDSRDYVYAYALDGGARQTNKELDLPDAVNTSLWNMWSDGTTMWVLDRGLDKAHAYALADGTRQDGTNGTKNREFRFHRDSGNPYGIWSDGATMWVLDRDDDKVYAYNVCDLTAAGDSCAGAPDAPSVTAVSSSSLTVMWSAPDNDGPAITDYDVRYRAGTSGDWTDVNHDGAATTATLTGLASGATFQVSVRATNDAGSGPWSPPGSGTTYGPPQGFAAWSGDAQVTLTWTAPAAGADIARHEYRFKTTGDYPAEWTEIDESAPGGFNDASFVVTGLTNDVAYTFQLRRVNGAGVGDTAAEAGTVTPGSGVCGRTEQVRDAIVAAIAGVSDCADVTTAQLAGVTVLNLRSHANSKKIKSLRPDDFSGLTALQGLYLGGNELGSLPAGVFSGLTALQGLYLDNNDLTSLPAGVFSGLTALGQLNLSNNELSSLPDGIFSGLSALQDLRLNGNAVDPLPLTVTLEKNPDAVEIRTVVQTAAPFAVPLTVSVANGSLAAGATTITVPAGARESAWVGVTRTDGTTGAVTADIDLTTQPTLPLDSSQGHEGYAFVKSASDLPLRVLRGAPTGFAASNGNEQVTLTWDDPAADADIARHEYRFKTTGDYPAEWTGIDDSAPGGLHEDWVVVTGLTNDVAYTFQLRAVNAAGDGSTAAEAGPATPRSGVCGRTEQVRDAIVAAIAGVSDCADVTTTQLADVWRLELGSSGITSLQAGDFSGLTALQQLRLHKNELTSLPAGVFSGLTALNTLQLHNNELTSLPAGVFSGLTALYTLWLSNNELTSLPDNVFSGLTALNTLWLSGNEFSSLPDNVFSGLTALRTLYLSGGEFSSLPAGVFSGLTALNTLVLSGTELTSLPDNVFSGLTALEQLGLNGNEFSSLPDNVFSGLTALNTLDLSGTELSSLPDNVFSGLTALERLLLNGNKLSSLPADVFSGITALVLLYLDNNAEDPLPLAVTLERNPDAAEIRAVVLTAAPFAVPLSVSVANGGLAGGAATITVPAGARESAWVGVTRTAGTTGAVTADIDLTTQPTLPYTSSVNLHRGYAFVKSATDLPLTVLRGAPDAPSVSAASSSSLTVMWSAPDDGGSAITDYDVQYRAGASGDWTDGNHDGTATTATLTGLASGTTYEVQVRAADDEGPGAWSDSGSGSTDGQAVPAPTGFAASNGNEQVTLTWDDPAEDADIARHEYRFKTTGDYPAEWTAIDDSAPGGLHEDWVVVTGLTNDVAYTFQLRAVNAGGDASTAAEAGPATPRSGVCGRTEQVRDAIVARIAGVSDCADVTTTHLGRVTLLNLELDGIKSLQPGDFSGMAALSGLALNNNDLGSLPDNVFSGLTALEQLNLDGNDLGSLPDNVFSGLTALRILWLDGNDLSSLPDNVFSGLTALNEFHLSTNDLTSLPDGVFSGLTALEQLYLDGNELGSLPDNVFFGITALALLWLQRNAEDPLPLAVTLESNPDAVEIRAVVLTAAPFAVPLSVSVENGGLAGGAATITVPAGARESAWIGVTRTAGTTGAVTADIDLTTQPTLPYTTSIIRHRGYTFVRSASDLPLTVEPATDPVWSATMTAGDTQVGHGYDATDTPAIGALDDDDFDYGSLPYRVLAIDVTTNVVRFAVEPGGQLADETLTLEFGGHALAFSDRISAISVGLNLYWTVPAALDDLETEFPVGATATVCLRTDTQVCPAGRIVFNKPPAFMSPPAFSAAENQTAVGNVAAMDSDSEDNITGYEITGGADQSFFSIAATLGVLTFQSAPNFEDAQDADTDNEYEVTVQATSGTGTRVKTATQTITVTVTDVAGEAPGKPAAPTVSAASVTSLTVTWSAPANAGPAIDDYDVRYRAGTTGDWSDGNHTGTATTATLSGLSENTSYQVQVRATNDEGTGSWSDSGTGTTDANAAPTFSSSSTFDAAENQTAAGTVLATDGDTDDDVTGYEITGGADQSFFSIGATSGALTFDAAPNFEDAQDQGTNNTYVVTVEATSGTGTREKTATQTITVTVTDEDEAPGKPDAPSVSAASVSSLTVNWSAPDNGGPAITDYDVQYREGTSGSWSNGNHAGTATTATLSSLSENTSYQVQVRATNDEGTGSWSDSGNGRTSSNAAPTFSSSSTFDAAENQTSVGNVAAMDSDSEDNITGYEITGGADQAFFSIAATLGVLTFQSAPNFEDAQDADTDNEYEVTVQATSGTGTRVKTATQTITVTVTDVAGEAPGKPAAPDVSAASVSSLTVNWSAPANAGPAIDDYDVQYREGTSGSWSDGGHTGAATTATLSSLSENTSYQVQVRATNDEGTGSWSDSGSGTTDANAAPTFSSSSTFDAAENQTAAGTVLATDGDTDDDVTGYEITGGADQAFFSIASTSGALTFDAAPNFEDAQDQGTNNTYVVEVQATSGTGTREKTATQTITVTVTDEDEAPGKPDAPSVSAASVTSLTVNWSAPANAGPAITDYDVQYREGTSGSWSNGNHAGTATTATLSSLSENTSYQVQVRATNDEGTGSWSDSGNGRTSSNAAPTFSSSATFDAAENQTAAGTVLATDGDTGDDVTGYEITGGADQAFFSIGATSGALTFDAAPNFEAPSNANTDNDYVVTVEATSGTGTREKTATQTITVTVTDVAGEAPGKPAAPDVAAASVSSLTVSWSAPANAGPAIDDYDVQYRAGTSGSWSDGGHTGTATTATLSSLSENTSYQVQVRATNDEGTGSWSDSGTGTTDANAAPTFSSSSTFDAAENQTAVGNVAAMDSDSEDNITGYEITGGADQAFFSIAATLGVLTFQSAPNFEDAQDADTDNEYEVTVQATSGTGTRVKTATQTITVTVTDVAGEAPGKPDAPDVAAASVSSLTVSWSAPANAGPAIDDYDVQYRAGTSGSWSDGGHTGTATTATLSSLSENTSYQVQVRATNDEGTGSWSDSGTGTTDANAAPTFSSSSTFDAAENQTAAGTVLATDGDTDDDVTGYEITGGADQSFFSIGATSGALTFDAAPNFEDAEDQGTDNTYVVTVQATSGTGTREKTATQTITVTVTDVAGEAPGKPAAPDVAAASVSSLTVSWSAPANAGPAIDDYDVQYRAGTSGSWSDGGHTGTATTATLSSLSENTSYQVQVRATNDEGTGSWSDSGTGTTDANAAPTFSSSSTFDAAENQTAAGTVLATDGDTDDDVTGYEITGGADQSFFSIGATSGALTFDAAPNFEDAEDQGTNNTYVVEVQATSGTGTREKTATQTITVTVTDVAGEAPGKPDAPDVAAASVSSLTVSWSAPANAGPAIDDYDVQYRAGTSGSWSDGGHTGTATTATLSSLSENTSYQVQVRATNDEGTGSWSDSGSGTTDANAAPSFSSAAEFDAAENQTAAGTVLATDGDTDDDVTGYEITGGADQSFFSIGATSGALTFDAAPNFEDAEDQGTNNTYVVEVQATSGTGTREKTATQTITVTVTDVAGEAPGKPDAPDVAAASVSSLTVSWSAPANAGPAIDDYDVQYRAGTSGSWSDGGHTGTATTATLSSLSENTSYQVQVRATNDEGTGSWSDSGSGTTDANAAPSFSSAAEFDAAENQTAAGTVLATDGDTDDDVTGYEITGGADQSFFSIGATSGALTFDAAPNFEDAQDQGTNNTYVVTVEATSGTGTREKTATQTITVTVTDEDEAPGKPDAPSVSAASVSSLTVNWSAPDNGGPAITDYDVQYREGTSGSWSNGNHAGTATTATLSGLSENTSYQVQVRATNDEGTGSWSDSGSGSTDANAAPTFSSSATFDAAENQTAAGTVLATDGDTGDDVTGYEITGGADQSFFSIGATSGALTFDAAPNFEAPSNANTDNDYVVTVEATSGTGTREKTATQTITVTVTDVAGEAPGKPAAPDVAAASVSSLTVSWSAPANAGPAIDDYDVQYRAGTSGSWSDGGHTGTATTATLSSLSENTSYQVQVRATNDEGTGSWSDSGTGTTDANAAPTFSSSSTFDAAENQTAAGTVLATDGDTDDDVTGYEITGGADQSFFSIGATSGALTFDAAPNFEDAQDQGTNNTYVVTVEATSGTGTREKTATQTITVTVTDEDEAPGKPDAPSVSAASVSSLTVNWSAPDNGGPAIDDYDVRYRAGTTGDWSDGNHTGTATTATLSGLSENTSYQVQVRATNDEGTGSWSDSGTGTTDANAAPTFSSSSTFDAAENQTAAGTVLATDGDTDDDVTGYEITGGADQSFFSIGATSGALTFDDAPNFEDAQDQGTNNTYVVEVQATSGTGTREKTATQTITVTVTDVAGEAPGKPAAPDVAAASVSSLTVSWSAPANAGPAIDDYDVQYRAGTTGDWSDGNHTGTATTATLSGLSENTSYQVQVRATNDEGTGSWSDSGTGTTDANAAPSFSSAAEFDAAENQTAAGTVLATDGDTDDDVTGYEITGGADQSFFSIGATSGALTFDAAPNFEDAQDQGTNNTYVVTVEATSGTGTREKTATQTITVTVTDEDEAPGKPDAPSVSAASVSSLTVNWSAPANAGPAITDYDVQYREGTSGSWSNGNHAGTAVTATLSSLSENTSYQVQVRATNDEGTGSWSDSGTGGTDANAAPAFSSSATFDAAENQTSAGTVVATDDDTDDNITGYAITGGADQGFFSIGARSGELTFDDAPDFEEPQDQGADNTYQVTVQATSGTGTREKTATQTVMVTVTDVDEQPPPREVEAEAASHTSLAVRWEAPETDGGPAVTGYELRYREHPGSDWEDWPHSGTATRALIAGLEVDTAYEIEVRALYGATQSAWVRVPGQLRTNALPSARVRNVRLVSGPGPDAEWSAGERVELEVRYPEPVVVEQPRYWVNADGNRFPPGPYVAVVFRSDARPGYGEGLSVALVPYVSGSGTATLRFEYEVGRAEDGARGVEVASDGMLLRGATIRTLEGGDGASRYTNTRVMQVDVRKPSGAWTAGDKVRVEVRFTGPAQYTPPEEPQNRDEVDVDVEGGTPTIRLLLGDRERRRLARMASYAGGSGTNTLTFEYEVTAGDGQVSAVEVAANSLARNGATIRNEDGYDAELDHLGTVRYAPLALRVRAAAAREGGTLKFEMELAQAAEAPVTVDYETADGTATAGEDYTAKRGTVTFAPGHTRKTVAVPVLRDEEAEDAETVFLRLSNARSADSEAPVEVTVPEAEGTIEDVAPEAEEQEPQEQEEEEQPQAPPALTARFVAMPAKHNAKNAIRFRVAFSEDIGISFRSLREDAFTVSGGRVTGGKRVDGRRDLFEMTVRPVSNGDVTITLPAGRKCGVSGAICTKGENRRKLTNAPSATVRGPAAETQEPQEQEQKPQEQEEAAAEQEPQEQEQKPQEQEEAAAEQEPQQQEQEQPDQEEAAAAEQEPPQKPPPAPRNLTGVANDDGSVTLSWDAPGDDSVTGYRILRRHTVKQAPGVFSTLAANTGTTATTYTDGVASPETRYAYRVKAINAAGAGKRSNYVKVTTKRAAPSSKPVVADGPPGLAPNAPNPFNASTLIPYRLDASGPVRLEIYNLLGQSIRTLVDEVQAAGSYRVSWDARDAAGRRVSTGVYFLRLHYPGGVQTRRMLYLE